MFFRKARARRRLLEAYAARMREALRLDDQEALASLKTDAAKDLGEEDARMAYFAALALPPLTRI